MQRLSKTYIPFALVLVLFIFTVVWLDSKAVESNDNPIIVNVLEKESSLNSDNVDQLEMDLIVNSAKKEWMNDSIYKVAVHAKKQKQWKRAIANFNIVKNKYQKSEIENEIGSVYLNRGKYKKAMESFDEVLKTDSLNYSATLNKAITSVKLRQYKNAHKYYNKAIELSKQSPVPYLNKGILLTKENEFESSVGYLSKAAELSSGNIKSKSLAFLGVGYAGIGDTVKAKANLEEAINLKPSAIFPRLELANLAGSNEEKLAIYDKVLRLNEKSSLAHYYVAKVYQDQKDFGKAEFHIRKALELSPSDESIISAWTDILIVQEKLDEANEVLRKFNQEKDTLPTTFFFMAKMEVRKKNYNGALSLYNKAIERSGNDYPEAALNKGVILKNQGNLYAAIQSYQHAIQMKNNYAAAHYNLGILFAKQDSTDLAIDHYEKAIQYNPKKYKAYYNLARIYSKEKELGKAEGALKNAIAIEPKYEKAWLKLVDIYEAQKDDQKLGDTYESMIEKFPGNISIYAKYGRSILDGYGEIEKAQIIAEKGLEKTPDNEEILVLLGDIRVRQKDPEEAINFYASALEIKPDLADVHFKIGELHMKSGTTDLAIKSFQKVVALSSKNKKAFDYLFTLLNDEPLALNQVKYAYYKEYEDGKEMYQVARELDKLKQLNLAIKAYKTAWKQGEQTYWCAYWTGKGYHDLNDLSKAKKYYKRALKKKRSHKFSIYRLVQIYQVENDQENYNKYATKLISKYPEFAKEKGVKI